MPPQQHRLFQVNRHVQASIMLLSIMDGAELDLNSTILSSNSKTTATTATTSSLSTSDDYEKGFSLKER
jgi:ABC-type lipoprotein release transport system permease subunit